MGIKSVSCYLEDNSGVCANENIEESESRLLQLNAGRRLSASMIFSKAQSPLLSSK